jgi:response regulator RpfG family c-di-GMP phosphodiesterase
MQPDCHRQPHAGLCADNVVAHQFEAARHDGYNILTAASDAEGFKKLTLNPVHVVLRDQRMPEMNGTEFLDKVKNLYPDTFRIVLSGYTDVDAIMDAVNRGTLYRFLPTLGQQGLARQHPGGIPPLLANA